MTITAPTPVAAGPAVPDSSNDEATFDAQFEAWNNWERDTLRPGMNALAGVTYTNAQEAATSASSAATSESNALTYKNAASSSATNAALSEANLAALNALWLGALPSDPTTGKAGAPLVAGNAYVNTATGYLRAYNGTAWVQGISAVSGVSSVNGQTGAVTVQGAPSFLLTNQGII